MPTFAHCATSDHQDLVSPPPALVADWLKALCGTACPRAAAGLQSTNTAGAVTAGLGEEL